MEVDEENFQDRQIEYLVIYTSADVDFANLEKNKIEFNLDEPPEISKLFIIPSATEEENASKKFLQLEKINNYLHEKLVKIFLEFEGGKKLKIKEKEKEINLFSKKFVIKINQPKADVLETQLMHQFQNDLLNDAPSAGLSNEITNFSFQEYKKKLE